MEKLECDDTKFLHCLLMYIMTRQGLLEINLTIYKNKLETAKADLEKATNEGLSAIDLFPFEMDVTRYDFQVSVTEQFIKECQLAVDNIRNGNHTSSLAELIQHLTCNLGSMNSLAIREKFKEIANQR